MPLTPSDRIELPDTLRRSPRHAQEIFTETLRSAIEEYGDGERARRTAYAAVKNSFEKVGDHWERKAENGPSDDESGMTHGGVDAHATKDHLLRLATRLDVRGRSRMTKEQLVAALERANERLTHDAREAS